MMFWTGFWLACGLVLGGFFAFLICLCFLACFVDLEEAMMADLVQELLAMRQKVEQRSTMDQSWAISY